jgi:hypothetical protein
MENHQRPVSDDRRTWIQPRLARLKAGEAELGANPAKTEQAFAYGS